MAMRMGLSGIIIVVLLSFTLYLEAAPCSSLPSVDCTGNGCQIYNYQGLWEDHENCMAANSSSPKSEAELVQVVAKAVKNKQKVRVVSWLGHSLTKLACVGNQGLIISTKNYNQIISINKTAMTITVQAGAMMSDVMEAAASQGLSLPAMIYWNGVSAAGVISTGAHGSGLIGKGSGVYEYVVGMRLVVPASPLLGYAKVITLREYDEDLKAARISLGMLGVISEITFALQPMYKRSVSASLKDDGGLENEAESFLRGVDFSDIYWIPSHGKALFRNISKVSVNVPGDGFSILLGTPTRVVDIENSAAQMASLQANAATQTICKVLESQMNTLAFNGSAFLNGPTGFTGYPIVGFNHKMQASGGCQGSVPKPADNSSFTCNSTSIVDKNTTVCTWDRRIDAILLYDVEIQVRMSNLTAVIQDMKKIRDLNPENLCDLRGTLIRSIKKSDAYLGHAEDTVAMETIYYKFRDENMIKWNGDVFEEIEQMVIEKYGGVMHWGKSGGHLFKGQALRASNITKFLEVKMRYDPYGLFSNEWTDGLFGIEGPLMDIERDGCALDKLCKCTEDRHCAPDKGYFCMPGKVWTNARVCRKRS
ncbi:hypothetical protein SUGI_0488410 [Cryptomeria japonica]|nr:hypothetical protein SUGI_0488410 [Cryptomeria japonica]